MRILVSGARGFVGSALVSRLREAGHTIGTLVRRSADHRFHEVYWDPERGSLDKVPLADFAPEAVVHLAGESVASGRWNEAKKAKIRNSRVNGTHILAQAIATLQTPPKAMVCASAVGYYGSRGKELLIESTAPGEGFLAQVCQEWEAAAQPARDQGIRVVHLRFGMVLGSEGGALKKMLTPFRLGLGGILGNGEQFTSWITLDDVVGAIEFSLQNENLAGPVNAVTPNPVTNREFTKTLGRVLFRPTCFPMPASIARMVFGEMADELLLASARVKPGALEKAGFHFQYPELKAALKHVLEK